MSTKLLLSLSLLFWAERAAAQVHFNFCIPGSNPVFHECEGLNCMTCDLNGMNLNTEGYGPDEDGDLLNLGWCGDDEHVQYVAFYAAEDQMDITVTASNCILDSGIDLGIMPFCDVAVINCIKGAGSNSETMSVSGLTIGNTYILIINSDGDKPCDLSISVNPSTATSATSVSASIDEIQGPTVVCIQETAVYTLEPLINGINYSWSTPPGITSATPSQDGHTMTIAWGNSQGGNVCVNAVNPCTDDTKTLCINVLVSHIPPTIIPHVKVCAEDAPFMLPWGEVADESKEYFYTYPSVNGCDSLVKQMVTLLQPIEHVDPTEELCPGSCLTKCGQSFCDVGDFEVTCQSYLGCDSVISFTIIPPSMTADIIGAGNIDCAHSSILLNATPTLGSLTWTNAAGQVLSHTSILQVSTPGAYYLQVSKMVQGKVCTMSDSIFVSADTLKPGLLATADSLGCDTLPAKVHAHSIAGPIQFHWSGPNGFSSDMPEPIVNEAGMYTVAITNPSNGCSNVDTVQVVYCCKNFAGSFDTLPLSVCGMGLIQAVFHNDQLLGANDSLAYVLYSDPENPLGSVLIYSDTSLFPFVPGIQQFDSTYYVAALIGLASPQHYIRTDSLCWSFSNAQPVHWVKRPTISLSQLPGSVCKGACADIAFDFIGTPPFQFHLEVTQNGVPIYSKDLTANALHQVFTLCPSDFLQPPDAGALNFNVGYLNDSHCDCGN